MSKNAQLFKYRGRQHEDLRSPSTPIAFRADGPSTRLPPRSPSVPIAPIGQPASSPASPPLAQRPHRLPCQPPSTPIAFRAKRQGWVLQRELLPRSPKRRGLSSAERWRDLRPMRDSRGLGTKRSPPWQDSRAMYPKSPDYTPKRTHGTKILPSSARKACISRERCQGGDLFCAIGEKRIHTARFLPHQQKQP